MRETTRVEDAVRPVAHHDRGVPAQQKRTLAVLVVMQVIGTIGVGVAPSIGVLLASEVTGNEALAGLARTASTFGAALLGLPLGTLAARRGRRVALTTGWWSAAAGGALLVAAAQWGMLVPLFVGLLLIGAGSAVALQARFAATDLATPEQKGRSLSLVVWVGTLGMVLGPNLGAPGELVGSFTGLTVYASAFLIAAICMALAGAIVFLLLRPDPLLLLLSSAQNGGRIAGPRPPMRDRLAAMRAELAGNRQARYAVVAILTAQAVMVAVMTMTPVHIVHQGGSVTIVGITISLHIAGMYGLAPVVGFLTDRYGPRPTIVAGLAIFLASLVIGMVVPGSAGWLITSLVLLGVGWSFVNVAGSALFSRVVPEETRASSQGAVDAAANLCGATAALAAGPLLVLTSFSLLSLLSVVVLVPLAVLTASARLGGWTTSAGGSEPVGPSAPVDSSREDDRG
ncbi:MFS transporter [Dietzia aurantiaca]|uniref:MFS transporter n=1 Tax=Dietzia aurantiaca TaxID=983873 RepID=UPI001E36F625|nr:MFS transporter [Dietzia aurantiaca]